jgi:hypothetical protein
MKRNDHTPRRDELNIQLAPRTLYMPIHLTLSCTDSAIHPKKNHRYDSQIFKLPSVRVDPVFLSKNILSLVQVPILVDQSHKSKPLEQQNIVPAPASPLRLDIATYLILRLINARCRSCSCIVGTYLLS